jgi:hypothetical protein
MMHAIYTRLIELIEKDPTNIDELEDWINDALELSNSEEECMALTNAVTHAKKELLLLDLSKHLLMGDTDEDEEDAREKRITRTQLAMAAQTKNKIHMTKTQMEILRKIYESDQKRIKDEPTYY